MSAGDDALAQAAEVARRMAGATVEVSRVAAGGRNSRIWRVRNGGRDYALKQYPVRTAAARDRLAIEVGALRLMERHHIDSVPRVIAVDSERGYAMLSWIEGREVLDVGDADIVAAADFLAAIHALRDAPWAAQQPPAAEACLSGGEIERQIGERLARLREAAAGEAELLQFLDARYGGALTEALAAARAKLDFDAELAPRWRSLVPSDFGFHNSLRRSDGSLAFFDFEYFGWDDPVKLTADVLLHPGRPLPAAQRKRFRDAALRLYGSDPGFANRLAACLPLFGLRWALIMLNEYVPERWQRRVAAGETMSWDDAKARQLAAAREFLTDLPEKIEL